jgi:hypothetical protein
VDLQQARAKFNNETAPAVAAQVGDFTRLPGTGYSKRFTYFANDDQFLVVAGPQEANHVELAFALGLTYRQGRQLVLVLPRDHAFSTLQRAPWFNEDARPDIWLHNGQHIEHDVLPSQDDTVQALSDRLKPNQTLADELRDAATAVHLDTRASSVQELAEWATTEPLLDPSHRRGERSWHCMGQRVLSIKPTTGGVAITAGIHYTKPEQAPTAVAVGKNESLSPADLGAIKDQVRAGMHERLHGAPPIHRPDEHWLQAVIRRDPSLVGVEQPALRELPAWRPTGEANKWGRGYIDLIGVDGHGDIRVVETKIADNKDALLVLQGLDYYVWALAYRDVLLGRLGASTKAAFEIHYVIGADQNGSVTLSPYTASQALGLDERIPWHFQHVYDWYGDPSDGGPAGSELLPARTLEVSA